MRMTVLEFGCEACKECLFIVYNSEIHSSTGSRGGIKV